MPFEAGILRARPVHVISANRLADGVVVYLDPNGSWAQGLSGARIFPTKAEAEAAFLAAQEDAKRNLIVEPCLVEVKKDPAGMRPVTLRETIRAQGPTIDFLPREQARVGAKLLQEGAEKRDTAFLRVPLGEEACAHEAAERSLTPASCA